MVLMPNPCLILLSVLFPFATVHCVRGALGCVRWCVLGVHELVSNVCMCLCVLQCIRVCVGVCALAGTCAPACVLACILMCVHVRPISEAVSRGYFVRLVVL